MPEEGKATTGRKPSAEEPPPVLGSWGRLYAAVLILLFVIILGLFAFTRYFEGGAP